MSFCTLGLQCQATENRFLQKYLHMNADQVPLFPIVRVLLLTRRFFFCLCVCQERVVFKVKEPGLTPWWALHVHSEGQSKKCSRVHAAGGLSMDSEYSIRIRMERGMGLRNNGIVEVRIGDIQVRED